MIAYQKYSGLDTLYLEFYNEHLQYPGDKGKVMRKLVGVDEKTAAVIMAIISQRSEIPLNRLRFKSIKLVDDSEKGGAAK